MNANEYLLSPLFTVTPAWKSPVKGWVSEKKFSFILHTDFIRHHFTLPHSRLTILMGK